MAELSFIVLLALASDAVVRDTTDEAWQHAMLGSAVVAIALAQTCCWASAITTSELWNAREESLWVVATALLVVPLARVYAAARGNTPHMAYLHKTLPVAFAIAAAYTTYMVTTDVPMYIDRWQRRRDDPIRHRPWLHGLRDLLQCKQVTTSADVWKEDALWRMGYFSGAVWLAMGVVAWYERFETLVYSPSPPPSPSALPLPPEGSPAADLLSLSFQNFK